MKENLSTLEEKIGYSFKNKLLLHQAMLHRSYANEIGAGRVGSNERLEFLGDAVLELISSRFLYDTYKNMPEGDLTKKRASLVCEPSLARCARVLGLQDHILLGRGEEMGGGRQRDSIVSDATEALIGAIFLDGGLKNAKAFILTHILNDIENQQLFYDSKTILQEMTQEDGQQVIEYRLLGEEGPDHDKRFRFQVLLRGVPMGEGVGHNKKAAEMEAAYQAILRLKQERKA